MATRDDQRRVATPRQRTRDDPVEVDMRKGFGDGLGLLATALRERAVGPPRETARRVRLALAVADEVEGDGLGHAAASRSATSDQPVTRVTRRCCTSRFHGWSNR